jgi:hypothetical protein
LSLRKSEDRIAGDQRILGNEDFVERVLSESERPSRDRRNPVERSKKIDAILREECQKGKIGLEELRMGSRRGDVPRVRLEITERMVKELGASLGETARPLGVFTSAISKIMKRRVSGDKQ